MTCQFMLAYYARNSHDARYLRAPEMPEYRVIGGQCMPISRLHVVDSTSQLGRGTVSLEAEQYHLAGWYFIV